MLRPGKREAGGSRKMKWAEFVLDFWRLFSGMSKKKRGTMECREQLLPLFGRKLCREAEYKLL